MYKLKKRYIVLPAVAVVALLGVSTASAHGFGGGMGFSDPETMAVRFTEHMTQEASILGITVDEIVRRLSSIIE